MGLFREAKVLFENPDQERSVDGMVLFHPSIENALEQLADLHSTYSHLVNCDSLQFPEGCLVEYDDPARRNPPKRGIVLKMLTRNGWFIVIDSTGRPDLTGEPMMRRLA